MDKRDTERVIRMAISSTVAAQSRIKTLPVKPDEKSEGDILSALQALDDAVWNVGQWAKRNGYAVTTEMVT